MIRWRHVLGSTLYTMGYCAFAITVRAIRLRSQYAEVGQARRGHRGQTEGSEKHGQ